MKRSVVRLSPAVRQEGTGYESRSRPSHFDPGDYQRGRGVAWQAGWHIIQNLVWRKWWLPDPARAWILRRFGAQVGAKVRVREGVYVHWPWRLSIDDYSQIGRNVSIYNLVDVDIGKECIVSQEAIITSGSHAVSSETFSYDNRPVLINDGAWVAARAVILAGSELGADCVIAAGVVFSGIAKENTVYIARAELRTAGRYETAAGNDGKP